MCTPVQSLFPFLKGKDTMPVKIRTRLCLMILFVGMTSIVYSQDAPSDNNIQYNWAFVARAGDAGSRHIGVVTKDTSIEKRR